MEKIIAEYPVVEGRAALLMDSGEAKRLQRAGALDKVVVEKRSGREEITAVEYRLHGQPVYVEMRGRLYEDPAATVETAHICRIVCGFSRDEGLITADRSEIAAIMDALRKHTYRYLVIAGYPRYRTHVHAATHASRCVSQGSSSHHACTMGLYVHLADGSVRVIDGHAEEGHVTGYARNHELKTVMARVLANHKDVPRTPGFRRSRPGGPLPTRAEPSRPPGSAPEREGEAGGDE
ncbi:MAG: hypothetical protein ACYTFI_08640 [Planctomycetota bacterium]